MSIRVELELHRPGFALQANFTTAAQGITAIAGASGAGKTTLLRAIAGLEQANGKVSIGAHIWQDGDRCVPVHERRLGFVFQEASLFPHLDVRGNLHYAAQRCRDTAAAPGLADICALLRLDALLDRSPATLSGGERQRVAIGRALLTGPRLLLMDEPLAGLDTQHKRELLPYLDTLHRELQIPVLYVSHAADEIARLADELVLLESGRTIAHGPVNAMLTRLDLRLAHDDDAAAILFATTVTADAGHGLAELACDTGPLWVPADGTTSGKVRVRIMARDVSIALTRPEQTSILNVLPAIIIALDDENAAQCLLQLAVGGQTLLSRITRRSAEHLQLRTGMHVYAQIKTMALLN